MRYFQAAWKQSLKEFYHVSIRCSFRSRQITHSNGLWTWFGARASDPDNCDGLLFDDVLWVERAQEDHRDFAKKMRERGIEVLEMHQMLAETVQNKEALKWILDRKFSPTMIAQPIIGELRSWFEGLSAQEQARYLIGGVSTLDLTPETSHKTWLT